jgi:hypothetical protein
LRSLVSLFLEYKLKSMNVPSRLSIWTRSES